MNVQKFRMYRRDFLDSLEEYNSSKGFGVPGFFWYLYDLAYNLAATSSVSEPYEDFIIYIFNIPENISALAARCVRKYHP